MWLLLWKVNNLFAIIYLNRVYQFYNFNSKQLRQCSFCKFMHYCSQTCQRNDWVIHKYECASFKKLRATEISMIKDDFVRLLIRVLIRAKVFIRKFTVPCVRYEFLCESSFLEQWKTSNWWCWIKDFREFNGSLVYYNLIFLVIYFNVLTMSSS